MWARKGIEKGHRPSDNNNIGTVPMEVSESLTLDTGRSEAVMGVPSLIFRSDAIRDVFQSSCAGLSELLCEYFVSLK